MIDQIGKPLSELARVMTSLPQVLVNVRVRQKADLAGIAPIKQVIEEVEAELAGKGRVLVRYSGTEPLLRIMVEAEDDTLMNDVAQALQEAALADLGQG